MNFKDYKAVKALNLSSLVEIERSPAHFKYKLENPIEETEALSKGRLIHCLILTPNEFKNDFFVMPKVDKRTKDGKLLFDELSKKAEGKEIINESDYNECKKIADSVLSSPKIRSMLVKGEAEKSYFWNLEGVEMKSRLDFVSNIILDVKTCQDARERQFSSDCIKYHYDVKLAAYQMAVEQIEGERKKVIILAVEKSPPYAFQVHYLNDDWMKIGREKLFKMILKYKECLEKNEWESYSHDVNELVLPSWIKN